MPYTIIDAAKALNVSERKMRRTLATTEFGQRTVSELRQTKTGPRTAELIPDDLFADLQQHLMRPTPTEPPPATEAPETSMMVVMPEYVRLLLAEKDKRIEDLSAALEHERIQSRQLLDTTARAQALLAMTHQEQQEPFPTPPPGIWDWLFHRGKRGDSSKPG